MNTWDISKLWPQHIALLGVWDCVCPPANSQTTKLRPPRVYRIDFTMVFTSRKKRIPSNILQSGAVPKQGYPATPKIIQAIRPWISIETYGVLEIRYSNRNHQIKSQLVGNGADRRLVVLRACAWISHWNCLCSVARVFLDVLRTTSTIEQLAASFSELLPRSSVLRHIHCQTLCSNFEEWVTKSPVPLFLEASLGSQHFNDFQSESMVCVRPTDQRHMNVSIPPHPTPPHDQRNIMSVTWTLTSTPPHDQRNIMSVTWTLTSHPTPTQAIIKKNNKKQTKKHTHKKKQQNTQAPCSAQGN